MDWEEAKNESPSLNVGHEAIRPESVLETIYLAVSKGREGDFKKYRQVGKTLKQIEEKVDKELQSRQGEGADYEPILKKDLSWSLGALRKLPQVEVVRGAGDGKVDEAIADGALNALVGLMKKRLTLEERRIFATPHRQLAEALGHGLLAMSAPKPLVMLLDTYEIVDRLECDRVLRMVIKAVGRRVVWAIAADMMTLVGTSANGQFRTGLASETLGNGTAGNAGSMTLSARVLNIWGGAGISTTRQSRGRGGNIAIAADSIDITGRSSNGLVRSGVSSEAQDITNAGRSGNIQILW